MDRPQQINQKKLDQSFDEKIEHQNKIVIEIVWTVFISMLTAVITVILSRG